MKTALILGILCTLAAAQIPKLDAPVTTDRKIALYEKWVAGDPHNISDRTMLAAAYIQKTRETYDYGYLDRASKIVDQILADKNDYQARRLRNLIELNRHHFSKVAEYAREMTRTTPLDTENWGSLGDALMEMGQYDEARLAFQKMMSIRRNLFSLNRNAYYRFVTGDIDGAIAMMSEAVQAGAPYPENKAWCLVELGNMYFKTARWAEAAQFFRQAIEVFPESHAGYAGLGAAQAAQGETAEAIESYKKAQAMIPMPQYAAALYDLYEIAGLKAEAQHQQELIDLVAKLEAASNFKANRTLALIFANQERRLSDSLELAQADFDVRKDVYTYDALAWSMYRNRRFAEAQRASQQALKMGTPEALFYYHAGMIGLALGDSAGAAKALEKALKLNPGFDVRQAVSARAALAGLAPVASRN